MVTEQMIKKEFIHQTISYGIRKIYSIQAEVISSELNTFSGNLSAWAKKSEFTISESDTRSAYYIRVLPYLRFLEINYRKRNDRLSKHRRSKLALYNRAVWGVIYGDTFPALRHAFTNDIRQYIRQQLEQSLSVDSDRLAALVNY